MIQNDWLIKLLQKQCSCNVPNCTGCAKNAKAIRAELGKRMPKEKEDKHGGLQLYPEGYNQALKEVRSIIGKN